ncbi:MAG: ribbon-helix-helix domain-containing protein [Cyclobacteriaceae bacterium]|nr:ribbon-helix-helix domain-containing protein [Cyclobacteriaceae bacterium]
MAIINTYKSKNEKKKDIVYCRMDDSMQEALDEIRKATGISKSELIREAVRRLISEVKLRGDVRISI